METININGVEYRRYDHLYVVAKDGTILRNLTPATLIVRPDGYIQIGRRRLAHRMVAICWLEKPEGASQVHHRNCDKSNNSADNLEWVTPKQHIGERHKDTVGRQPMPESARQKLREFRTGWKTPESVKQKQREASLRLGCKPPSWEGKTHSLETRKKMSINHGKATPCEINGIQYVSYVEAEKALGEKRGYVRKKCLSDKFPNYRRLL